MIRNAFIYPIKFYQKNISPHRKACCRFYPSCSQYAAEAISERGVIIGLALASYRLLRCNPLCEGGYDPVKKPRGSAKSACGKDIYKTGGN